MDEVLSVGPQTRLGLLGDSILVPWDLPSQVDLLWWCSEDRLKEGVSLNVSSPDLMFWSDASDQGWGATVGDQFTSGLLLQGEASLSVNHRELLAVQRGLMSFQNLMFGRLVAVFSDTTTVVSYLRKQGGTFSPALNKVSADTSLGGEGGDPHPSPVCSRSEQRSH